MERFEIEKMIDDLNKLIKEAEYEFTHSNHFDEEMQLKAKNALTFLNCARLFFNDIAIKIPMDEYSKEVLKNGS